MAWYDKKWVIWLAIILIFPIGLIMMWRSPSFGTKTKVIVTSLFALMIIFGGKQTNDPNEPKVKYTDAKTEKATPAPREYVAIDANTMMNDLERNAAAAQMKYKGQLICVTGRVGVIDSNGEYILIQSDNEFAITGIICYINSKDKAQMNALMNMQTGQYVRAYGEIKDVGEVIGYSLQVDKFEL